MTCDEFVTQFWSQYILIEKELSVTFQYVALSSENNKAFSHVYSKILLETCSEIDVALKQYCLDLGAKSKTNSIGKYKECIIEKDLDFAKQIVTVPSIGITLNPWGKWTEGNDPPSWWTVYNKVKHHRISRVTIDGETKEAYKFANQENAVLALAALYQILVYMYVRLARNESKEILTPMPNSRLFILTGSLWDNIQFFDEIALFVKNGTLMMQMSHVHY